MTEPGNPSLLRAIGRALYYLGEAFCAFGIIALPVILSYLALGAGLLEGN